MNLQKNTTKKILTITTMNNKNIERLAQLERALKDGCDVSYEVQLLTNLLKMDTSKEEAWEEIERCCEYQNILEIRELLAYIENYNN
jgi:hypothetical protein